MSRRIYFELTGETDWTKKINPDFGSIAALIFYANTLNISMGEKMIYACLSEASYRYEKDIPQGSYTSDNYSAHYGVNEMQELISFINNQLIPSLQNESQNKDMIYDVYGGKFSFIDSYYNGPEYLGYLGINEDDIVEGYTGYIPNMLQKVLELRDFYQRVKDLNQPYEIYVE
ncbi:MULTISPECIES: hypothetical protein [Chryseobacterium]|uniref:Uncharacterized protein n=1 Tax=Chryseobacterium taihuense TaxID=1141221 RepID=A0A4U8WJ82_9FLAO|nr:MULTISPECIES: hypothetical protein [Chryseobacterium]QQV01267.1 hypothetical protein I6I61_09115 [Chryseobacterium sp. FDAARGOS 1104]VFB02139.1 Uncharacterised protein [Chryseobacterium taihuense]